MIILIFIQTMKKGYPTWNLENNPYLICEYVLYAKLVKDPFHKDLEIEEMIFIPIRIVYFKYAQYLCLYGKNDFFIGIFFFWKMGLF